MLGTLPVRAAVIFLAAILSTTAVAQIITTQPPPLPAWDYPAVQQISRELAAATEQIRLAASEQTRPSQRKQATALAELTTLADAARHFAGRIDQYGEGPARTRQDYLSLVDVYRRAREAALAAGYDSRVLQSLSGIEPLLDRLSLVYTSRWDQDAAGKAAAELVAAVGDAYRIAQRQAVAGESADRAVFLLERLAHTAEYFNRRLASRTDTLNLGEDLRMLLDDYTATVRGVRPTRFDEQLEADLDRAGQALSQLSKIYQVPWHGPSARAVADQIRVSAQHIVGTGMARTLEEDGPTQAALNDLNVFVHAAEQLARRLELWPEMPAQHYLDFLALTAAYDRAGFTLSRASFAALVLDEFNKVGHWLTQLDRMYAGGLDPTTIPPLRMSAH